MTMNTPSLLREMRRAALRVGGGELSDGELLQRFLQGREEEAFRALVQRHGPMVLGVCHRVLSNTHDADDAFQATFLVLVRKGKSFSPRQALGPWLYGVAYHTALKLRGAAVKRRSKERQVSERGAPATASSEDHAELCALLDQELARLPERYRQAVILCELQGKSRKEAAAQLGIPEGTLSSRLATARKKLARRLAHLGLGSASAVLTALLTPSTGTAHVPASLATSAVRAATAVAFGKTIGVLSARVAVLTEAVLESMLVNKVKSATLVLVAVGCLFVGASPVASSFMTNPALGALVASPAVMRHPGPPKNRSEQVRSGSFFLPCLVSLCFTQAVPAQQPPIDDLSKQIERLIAQLGSEKFQDREAATAELKKLGEKAIPALEKALKSPDAEISRRAKGLLEQIRPPRESITVGSLSGNMALPLKGTYKKISIRDINGTGKLSGTDLDAEEIEIGSVNGQGTVLLQGKVKTLRLGTINGEAQFDASNLIADTIEVGEINGVARLKLHSRAGMRLLGAINGATTIDLKAQGDIRVEKSIDGAGILTLTTRGNVVFDERINGSPRVIVSLCKDLLVNRRVEGSSSVEANYHGSANCEGAPGTRIRLNKVDAPR